MSTKFSILFLTIGLSFLLAACGSDDSDNKQFKLSYRERVIVDSIVNAATKTLGPKMDSICKAQEQMMIQHLTDSIVQRRKQEEIKLRNRNLKNND